MHVCSFSSATESASESQSDWNSRFQFLFTAFFLVLGFLYILRTAASNYFFLHTNFDSSSDSSMGSPSNDDQCAVCAKPTTKQCAGCKSVKYCSHNCQSEHWRSGHKSKCKELKLSGKVKSVKSPSSGKRSSSVALFPSSGAEKTRKLVDKVLFPYDEFVELFNWDREIFPPCGLLNCGNSCFANVILQCLAHTRPLLAYLLDKGHRRDCKRNEWCFLCELQTHMERASRSQQSFSPINILSRLPSIGGNLGYGRQEDAHEFMRFSIDTMQSVCLDEHGGEKVIHPKSQETTLIQHIFGGQLQSQVICTKCNQVSNQYENMMDLTVEIQGDATSLEECLDQFTAKEWLDGENMYKCDGCNDYVGAWKRLSIHQAPNILTIALKRFQSGRFGKINKRITFPQSLDLTPYMSKGRDGTDKYKLYAVVVHVDMLNASYFGHYICYTKGFQGEWYRIDDCKVTSVELDEVLSQGAYMLLYSRVSARPACLKTFESALQQQLQEKDKGTTVPKADISPIISSDACSNSSESSDSNCTSSHPHLLPDYEDTRNDLLSRVDPNFVNGSQEDSHTPYHISVEENGHDSSHSITLPLSNSSPALVENTDDNVTVNGFQAESNVSNGSPALVENTDDNVTVNGFQAESNVSNGSPALVENTDDNVTVNRFQAESNGKLEEEKSEDEPHVACDGESENSSGVKGDTQEVDVYINGSGCAEFSRERSDNMKCTDEMDIDISSGNLELVSDDMDVDYLEGNNVTCISNGQSEQSGNLLENR